jgi:hypothetical protein
VSFIESFSFARGAKNGESPGPETSIVSAPGLEFLDDPVNHPAVVEGFV